MLSEFDDASAPARKETEQRYERSLIEANPDALVAISREGKITDVNAGMIKVTGVPRKMLIGTEFAGYFTDPKLARELSPRAFADGVVIGYPLTFHREDGNRTDVIFNAGDFNDAQGEALGVCPRRHRKPPGRSKVPVARRIGARRDGPDQ